MHRHHTILLTLAIAFLSGCATSPTDNISPSTSHAPNTASPRTASNATSGAAAGSALSPVQIDTPRLQTLDLTAHVDDVWDRIRTGFAIPNMNSSLVVEQQAWYLSHQDFLQRAVDRSSHYLYHVVEELEKRHMPTELALLPFIESAYNPMAYSRAHAAGMWQFIPATGKDYNLQQDWWRDDRRDVVASTDAALSYLEALYEMHGDWTLALASYNWGEGSVKRAIDHNVAGNLATDYMSLNMPDETRFYFPKLQALKNIIANPEAFGVQLPRIDNQPYFVSVPNTRDMDTKTAARLAGMQLEDFRALNPAFNRPVMAGSPAATLLLPADRVDLFESNLRGTAEPLATWTAYTVRRGERLDRIAARYGMSANALAEANGIPVRARLKPGKEFLVQRRGAIAQVPPSALENAAPPQGAIRRASYTAQVATTPARTAVYVVHGGDTLSSIAKHFGTTVEALCLRNRLRGRVIDSGDRLAIPALVIASSQNPAVRGTTH